MRILGLIFILIIIGFLIGFVALNSQPRVSLDLFGQRIDNLPLSVVCFYSFAAGMIFILVFALANDIILRNNLRRVRKDNADLKKELDALRNLPFEEDK